MQNFEELSALYYKYKKIMLRKRNEKSMLLVLLQFKKAAYKLKPKHGYQWNSFQLSINQRLGAFRRSINFRFGREHGFTPFHSKELFKRLVK